MLKNKLSLFIIICFLITGLQTADSAKPVSAFSDQVIQHGAVGDDVIELQARLQYLGFYNGTIDGVFGWGTYWALRNFQYEFGMEIDGIAGTKTKEKLASASEYDRDYVNNQINQGNEFTHYGGMDNSEQSKQGQGGDTGDNTTENGTAGDANKNANAEPTAVNVPQGYSQNDIQLMANAVNGEARGEPYVGQVAVAAVILNRVESPTFPNSISGVVFEPRAFTAVADGQIWLTPNETSKKAVMDALNGWDPSGNATYYFNPETATSDWIWSRPQIKKIGKHIFAK
ncbi:N-acetylmuramoyl-L-alanine amidase [Lentibacillus persicus]|uniref:Spore cortex-lytic enzyme n=1 Tax=Lentibacillus persicus TaxID=640948 RepID=A0A1I1SWH1_9BACI|nr:spore cortex-lytic enzyme [Lentibacillus persicus]SFD50736.1 N-acetylmuramoyl-L-alanine amidase [Lentibacillus persicus]